MGWIVINLDRLRLWISGDDTYDFIFRSGLRTYLDDITFERLPFYGIGIAYDRPACSSLGRVRALIPAFYNTRLERRPRPELHSMDFVNPDASKNPKGNESEQYHPDLNVSYVHISPPIFVRPPTFQVDVVTAG